MVPNTPKRVTFASNTTTPAHAYSPSWVHGDTVNPPAHSKWAPMLTALVVDKPLKPVKAIIWKSMWVNQKPPRWWKQHANAMYDTTGKAL